MPRRSPASPRQKPRTRPGAISTTGGSRHSSSGRGSVESSRGPGRGRVVGRGRRASEASSRIGGGFRAMRPPQRASSSARPAAQLLTKASSASFTSSPWVQQQPVRGALDLDVRRVGEELLEAPRRDVDRQDVVGRAVQDQRGHVDRAGCRHGSPSARSAAPRRWPRCRPGSRPARWRRAPPARCASRGSRRGCRSPWRNPATKP